MDFTVIWCLNRNLVESLALWLEDHLQFPIPKQESQYPLLPGPVSVLKLNGQSLWQAEWHPPNKEIHILTPECYRTW